MIDASESDIFDSKALCALYMFGWGIGVFTDTEKIVEGNTDEIVDGLCLRIWMVDALKDEIVGNSDGNGQFLLWGWIFSFEAFYLLLESWPVDLSSLVLVRGAGFSSQLEGLGNGCQRLLNSLTANLIFSSGISSAYPTGKGLDKGKAFVVRAVGEVGILDLEEVSEEVGPVCPEFLPSLVSLSHNPMGCRSRRSSEKTSEVSLSCRWCMCQEAPCVRGKEWLNFVRSSESVNL